MVATVPEFSPRITSPTSNSYDPSILINSSGRLSNTNDPVALNVSGFAFIWTANFSPVLNSEDFCVAVNCG